MKISMQAVFLLLVISILLILNLSGVSANDCNVKIVNGTPERPKEFVSTSQFICYLDAWKKLSVPRYGKRYASIDQLDTFPETNEIEKMITLKEQPSIDWRDVYNYLSAYDD